MHKLDSKQLKKNPELAQKLSTIFEGLNSVVLLSCLQGHMGNAWVDDLDHPTVAQITVGIFVYYAGDSNSVEATDLLHNLPDYTLVIVEAEDWKRKVEEIHKGYNERFQRCSFKKESKYFDPEKLAKYRDSLPSGYELVELNAKLLTDSSFLELSEDFVSQFDDPSDFLNRGIGVCILHQGKPVCGATSYSIYNDGIEIEIATDPAHRRKGLATTAAAALILQCLGNGIYPNWDAANPESTALAVKLGYVVESEYDTYYIDTETARTSA
ncbi:GNAT family N-acetyltransferase [Pelagicoccus sp. NFK12]|uniref:GNAT family N-acetyltransferase n=1 Tax=Pelagicoccus enzymogenes TaxID=2773457 RepID=A0A927FD90_9BACT|nr:GNAT family N-acetyltransferase [Pelagicoccus enzymogenes]